MIRELFRKILIRLGVDTCVKCGGHDIKRHGFPAGPVKGIPGMTRNESNLRLECLMCGTEYRIP